MARLGVGVLARPHFLDDLEARVLAVRVDAEQPSALAERAHERRDHLLRLELERRAQAVGLRGDHHVVIGLALAAPRNHFVEHEAIVVAVDDERDRVLVDRVAGLRAVARLPVLGEERLERGDLLGEVVRGGAGERGLVPHHRGRGRHGARREPRRLGVVHVRDHEHRRRVLVEAVGHLAQAQAHVLEADLLAHDVERHRREAPVHLAHHLREHRAVAHAGVEQAHRGRARVDVAELEPDARRDHVLLAAGVDEEQVLLAVVEEAEVLFRRRLARCAPASRGPRSRG